MTRKQRAQQLLLLKRIADLVRERYRIEKGFHEDPANFLICHLHENWRQLKAACDEYEAFAQIVYAKEG